MLLVNPRGGKPRQGSSDVLLNVCQAQQVHHLGRAQFMLCRDDGTFRDSPNAVQFCTKCVAMKKPSVMTAGFACYLHGVRMLVAPALLAIPTGPQA